MSDSPQREESRADRIARYKEERRQQLNSQIQARLAGELGRKGTPEPVLVSPGGNRSVTGCSDGPRTTRTSRLRAAASGTTDIGVSRSPGSSAEKTTATYSTRNTCRTPETRSVDKDKSSKRKSNLNRSLNSEEIPTHDSLGDDKYTRRKRKIYPTLEPKELLIESLSPKEDVASNFTASSNQVSSVDANINATKTTPKKSQLAIHMENARKGISTANSDIVRNKPSSRNTSNSPTFVDKTHKELNGVAKHHQVKCNKENIKCTTPERDKKSKERLDVEHKISTSRLTDLSTLTKETLARVERLTNRNKNSPVRDLPKRVLNTQTRDLKYTSKSTSRPSSAEKAGPSILKKKSLEDVALEAPLLVIASSSPVSILKRKISQDDHRPETSTHTPPVTFSPSVKEPSSTNRKQGILKKRRSLDESLVLRRRSCSPEVANKADSKSILKSQRRSSLEELTRLHSPETQIQGILKRRTSKNEEEADQSFNSPQSILKRRSGASSAGSTANTPHVSITTAVILAAASGAEMVLDSDNVPVRPILKKKSISDDQSFSDTSHSDVPRPILKKKQPSTDTEDYDDRPRPILKPARGSAEREAEAESEAEMKPILKQHREDYFRSKLSFCEDGTGISQGVIRRHQRGSRRSNTICADYTSAVQLDGDEGAALEKERPLSVFELVTSFEQSTRTGAIPKKGLLVRSSERYKTQPVTSDEYEASLLYVASPSNEPLSSQYSLSPSSIQNGDSVKSFSSSSLRHTDLEGYCPKVSSDSAFQSLLDGLEMEESDSKSSEVSPKNSRPKGGLDQLMKAIANEAKMTKLSKGTSEPEKYREKKASASNLERTKGSRHVTQPVTLNEVQEASKLQQDDPSNLSLSERIRVFNQKILTEEKTKTFFAYTKESTTHTSNIKIPDITYDEGISCNDSGSDSENASAVITLGAMDGPPKSGSGLTRSFSARISRSNKYGTDSTSEGESSGGREVKNILGTDRSNIRQALEGLLSKSKSQIGLGNDHKVTVRRSNTTTSRKITKEDGMPQTIAELQATLQKKGESDWRKRYGQTNSIDDELKLLKEKNKYNVELSEKTTILASKKDELDAASKQWKSRVEKSDADKFSVSGKMDKSKESIPVNIPTVDIFKRPPQAKRFKGKEKDSSSTPTSPEKNGHLSLKRSQSNPDPSYQISHLNGSSPKLITKNVSVNRPDDFTFTNFYKSVEVKTSHVGQIELTLEDFDVIERHTLLVQKKNVQAQKRRGASKNPIKALAQRDDLRDEYTEVLTGVAERETKRLNIEKLAKSSSNFAIEALAGLASKEDFKSVPLKKGTGPSSLLPYKDVMLIQVKGRRHVQLRLVNPVAASINQGDCYILVTRGALYYFIGAYSNVIEQARAADVASHIQKTNDLGCKVPRVILIDSKMDPETSKDARNFWTLLGDPESVASAGNPSEDEIYESNILLTNMIYCLENDELVPLEEYWGAPPKYEMLTATAVLAFDFGTEMYVWSGKNAAAVEKQKVLKLAKELWNEGYNYSDCTVCPVNVALMLGERTPEKLPKKSDARPEWALFSKVTQHGETILFKEKFLDWPDFSRVIRVKRDSTDRNVDTTYDIKPINVDEMLEGDRSQPDIVVDGNHLGRGDSFFDNETNRLFQFDTSEIDVWRIMENTYEAVGEESIGQFYDADSYIVRWKFRITVKGRELSGKPSRHAQVGRDLTVFFYWQGCNSSINEKGVAALLTVELDSESAPQIRVAQGSEPAAFLRLFDGTMVVHKGKMRVSSPTKKLCKLFITRGEIEEESYLLEVPCNAHQLRSRSSLVLVDSKVNEVTIWHGCKSSRQTRRAVKKSVQSLLKDKPGEINLQSGAELKEIDEGAEDREFNKILGNSRNSYVSLLKSKQPFDFTPRFYGFSSVTGTFSATEVLCPHRSEHSSPLPILQDQLYSASQPALFLIDNEHELWLWQGWWPESVAGGVSVSDQTGSGAVRWQAERRAAMRTAINYWKQKHGESSGVKAELVWAGLEPVEFQNLFPFWEAKEDVAELNIKEGKRPMEKRNLEAELVLLSRTEFPLAELLDRPLPEGVDPTHLEDYLCPDDFEKILSMSKEEFQKLPPWKQTALKKEKGLF